MLSPLPVVRVSIQVLTRDARAAALVLAGSGVFAPQRAPEATQLEHDPAQTHRLRLLSAEGRLEKILSHYAIARPLNIEPPRVVDEAELAELDQRLGELWGQCSEDEERLRRLVEEETRLDNLLVTLENFTTLDIDLARLHEQAHFLDLRLGVIPAGNVHRLQEAVRLAGYVVSEFLQQGNQAHVVVAGPIGQEASVDNVLRAAGWRALAIPPEFSDRPHRVAQELRAVRGRVNKERVELEHRVREEGVRLVPELSEAARVLALAAPFADLDEGLRSRRELTVISGWVPKKQASSLHHELRRRLGTPVVMLSREPRPGEPVPSLMRHPRLLGPFVSLVKNYGIPRYGEFDPTLLFAITYIAMFGMMFGDIGHGAVIAVAGLLAHSQLRGFAPFVVFAGLASMGFGALYGSVFGYEDILHPLWIAPLTDPVLMLTVALFWGVGFILVVTLLNVYNRLVSRRVAEALFDGKGLAGVLLYLGLLNAAYEWLETGALERGDLVSFLLPLLVVLIYQWKKIQRPLGERALTVAIEGFETVMAYVSGTLSFLRVAAFSLNHVALASAVFALAAMMDTLGHWLTVVLGNVFIIVLEGAIVAIQALRLEYYEGFSRFFQGDGREFKPLGFRLASKREL